MDNNLDTIIPLYGEKRIVGIIGLLLKKELNFYDKELLKILSLQASSVILSLRSHQKLAEAEKQASLYKLSSFIIHDLKNYINNLSLVVTNKDKFSNPAFQEDVLSTLETTIKKMKALLEEFKTLRGELALNKKECRLADLVERALQI